MENVEEIDKFDDMDLKDELLRGIYAYGFETPSAIQKKGIVPLITGRDLIAQAQSGTGKTGTFLIGVLQKIDIDKKWCQAIILSPTRELSVQINKVLACLATYTGISSYACIGGTNIKNCVNSLKKGKQVVVGTPGRLYDMINRRALNLEHLKTMIIDEADDMLNRGFLDQIKALFEYIKPDVQVCLFSATLPRDILETTEKFMNNPLKIMVKKEELTLEGIQQYYVPLPDEKYKMETLCDIYENISINQAIIYCNTREKVQYLGDSLQKQDHAVSCIHGEMDFTERKKILQEFASGQTRILISTDLLARGIDIQQISLVINYELPMNRENYIHRIGRSGRFGRKGVAINLIIPQDIQKARHLETFYQTEMKELPNDFGELTA